MAEDKYAFGQLIPNQLSDDVWDSTLWRESESRQPIPLVDDTPGKSDAVPNLATEVAGLSQFRHGRVQGGAPAGTELAPSQRPG